ncbi:MAG: hypothetical protein GXP47_05165 [Acidobacteria bacterium]|nr:hypothetical protein [Acidobacteriota bacterium]
MAVVYRGLTTSGQLVAIKIPVEFVSHWEEIGREELSNLLAASVRRLQEEAEWLERLQDTGLFPVTFYPQVGQSVLHPAGKDHIPVLVLQWGEGMPLRQALKMVSDARKLLRLQSEAMREATTRVVARWMEGLVTGLRTILECGGVYTDVAPDNFLVQAQGGPVVFLDAGAIVPVGHRGPTQLRPNCLPVGYQEHVQALVERGGKDLERLLVGMVSKLITAGLGGEPPTAGEDPIPAWVEARVPLSSWLFRVLETCLEGGDGVCFESVLRDLRSCTGRLRTGRDRDEPSVWRVVGGAAWASRPRGG